MSYEAIYTPEDPFWSGYAGENREAKEYLQSVAMEMPYGWSDSGGRLPEKMDPRGHELFDKGFMRVENQGGVGACFPEGTLVLMSDGKTKPIEDVDVMDKVVAADGSTQPVTGVYQRHHRGQFVTMNFDGVSVRATADHVMLMPGMVGKHAIHLETTDSVAAGVNGEVIRQGGSLRLIGSRTDRPSTGERVHCIEVLNHPTMLVSNNPDGPFLAVSNCAGYANALCLEYLWGVLTGEVVQLSPMFAYLMAQRFDGISGDRGSTLSGHTKLNENIGLCLLETYPHEHSYPRGGYRAIPREAVEQAKKAPFKIQKVVRFRTADQWRGFCGSNMGIGQTGTRWTRAMAQVAMHGVIESIGGRSYGGHSWNVVGYMPIDEMGAEARRYVPRTRSEMINIVTNSHSKRWGDNGWGYLIDEYFEQLCREDQIIGRTDMPEAKPRPSKLDFTQAKHNRFSPVPYAA